MIVDGSAVSWPRSLLVIPLAAMVFGLQAVPVLNFFLGLASAEYWPGALIYAAVIGVGAEALMGRTSPGWLVLPLVVALLSVLPRLLEEQQIDGARIRVVEEEETGAGPGTGRLGVSVGEPEVARIMALRYDVPYVVASRDGTSVDRIMYRPAPGAARRLTVTTLPEEPPNVVYVGALVEPFSRGRTKGYEVRTTATWPDGRRRSRFGIRLARIGIPAFPIAGGGIGPGLAEKPFGGPLGTAEPTGVGLFPTRQP